MSYLTIPLTLVGLFLIVGIIVGPNIGIINADSVIGYFLFTIVSLCEAIILFKGPLTLKSIDIS